MKVVLFQKDLPKKVKLYLMDFLEIIKFIEKSDKACILLLFYYFTGRINHTILELKKILGKKFGHLLIDIHVIYLCWLRYDYHLNDCKTDLILYC